MKKILNILLLSTIVLFVGCSNKQNQKLNQNIRYEQNLLYTRVGKIIENQNITITLNVTYLNSANRSKYNDGYQNFLISLYSQDDIKFDKEKLKMNNRKAFLIEKVDTNSTLYKNIAIKNNWSDYYLVKFYNTKKQFLILDYIDNPDNILKLKFIKE
jgi:hypothetical protein